MPIRYTFLATGCLDKNASFVRLRELGRELARQGVDVHFVLDDVCNNGSLSANLQPATLHLVGGGSRAARLLTRRRVLRSLAPDAVHILNPQPLNTASVSGMGLRVVCDWDELLSARQWPRLRKAAVLLGEAHGRLIGSMHVVASRYLQQEFSKRFGIDALYLPYATYLPDVPASTNPFAQPTAVYLGNLLPDFDHDLVIDAWELLGRRGCPLRLSVIGGGPKLDSVRQHVVARGLSNVQIEGYMTGQPMWDRLRHSRVLLFPIRDTVGNRARCPSKTYAYMQARRPIITNRVGEVAEVLGDLGCYVDATPAAFAEAVEQVAYSDVADVDYPVQLHTWDERARRLLAGWEERFARPPQTTKA